MCQAEGKTRAATIADHVTPHRGNEDLFWNGELQSLCKPHHDRDKALIEAGKTLITYGLDGWPE